MKTLGIDFDNTVVTYDDVFYKYAYKSGLISQGTNKNKKEIRDAIRKLPEGNDRWTELQGAVYGTYMQEAEPVKGIEKFLEACRRNSCEIFIISHKTVYPFKGLRVNLQEAARKWLRERNFLSRFGLSDSSVIFEETLQGKFDRITEKKCAYFVDDLAEVLCHADFPKGVKKILYGRQENRDLPPDIMHFKDWDEIEKYLFG